MRTAILLGAMIIADAINIHWSASYPNGLTTFIIIVFVSGMTMDVLEFFFKNK